MLVRHKSPVYLLKPLQPDANYPISRSPRKLNHNDLSNCYNWNKDLLMMSDSTSDDLDKLNYLPDQL